MLLVRDSPSPVGIAIQVGFDKSLAIDKYIADLPRDAKKQLRRAISECQHRLPSDETFDDRLDAARRVLETLVAGRVAASLRVLTHELLTPLQGALNDAEEIKSGRTNAVDRLKLNLASIHNVAKQIHVLLSENLDPTPQRIRDVIVHNVIHKLCERLRIVAEQKHVTLHNTYNSGTTSVPAAPDQIETLFSCLLDNAVKYSFSGQENKYRKISIRYKNEVDCLTVSIHNYGCAITESEINGRTVFELGYRGECSGDRGRAGTGSGLYIAERIALAHGGRIEVQSKLPQTGAEGASNTVTVWWPKKIDRMRDG